MLVRAEGNAAVAGWKIYTMDPHAAPMKVETETLSSDPQCSSEAGGYTDIDFPLGKVDSNDCEKTPSDAPEACKKVQPTDAEKLECKTYNHAPISDLAICKEAARRAHAAMAHDGTENVPAGWEDRRPKGCFMAKCNHESGICYFFNPTALTPTRAKGTPVCQRPNFLAGQKDTNGLADKCPPGYRVLLDADECKIAGGCLSHGIGEPFKRHMQNAAEHDIFPEGCFVHEPEPSRQNLPDVYYNSPIDTVDTAGVTTRKAKPTHPVGTPMCNVSEVIKCTVKEESALTCPTPTAGTCSHYNAQDVGRGGWICRGDKVLDATKCDTACGGTDGPDCEIECCGESDATCAPTDGNQLDDISRLTKLHDIDGTTDVAAAEAGHFATEVGEKACATPSAPATNGKCSKYTCTGTGREINLAFCDFACSGDKCEETCCKDKPGAAGAASNPKCVAATATADTCGTWECTTADTDILNPDTCETECVDPAGSTIPSCDDAQCCIPKPADTPAAAAAAAATTAAAVTDAADAKQEAASSTATHTSAASTP